MRKCVCGGGIGAEGTRFFLPKKHLFCVFVGQFGDGVSCHKLVCNCVLLTTP